MADKCYDAFDRGDKEEALRLLKVVKDPREVKGNNGWTLLHHAATNGWTDIVELLITKYNFDVNSVDDYDCTPLHLACDTPIYDASDNIYGQLNVVKCLCNTGKCDLFIKDYLGRTPLDIARLLGRHEIVEYLTNIVSTSTLTCK